LAEKIGLRRAVKTAQIPDPNIIAAEILEDLLWRAVALAKEASCPRPVAEIVTDLKDSSGTDSRMPARRNSVATLIKTPPQALKLVR
jgi:hypothetical protein